MGTYIYLLVAGLTEVYCSIIAWSERYTKKRWNSTSVHYLRLLHQCLWYNGSLAAFHANICLMQFLFDAVVLIIFIPIYFTRTSLDGLG